MVLIQACGLSEEAVLPNLYFQCHENDVWGFTFSRAWGRGAWEGRGPCPTQGARRLEGACARPPPPAPVCRAATQVLATLAR